MDDNPLPLVPVRPLPDFIPGSGLRLAVAGSQVLLIACVAEPQGTAVLKRVSVSIHT